MIVYAACIGDPEKFRRICLPGVQRVAGPDDILIEAEHEQSIFAAYNEVLDVVRDRDDLEALVLLHEDTEVTDAALADLIRRQLAEPDVAIVGAVGARGVTGLSWWEAECFGRVAETRGTIDFGGGTHDVDTVDGLVMGLSPWAVRNLRFDDRSYEGFDAYDADICAQARAAGKRVVVTELPVVHRHTRVGNERSSSDGGSFARNERIFRSKWLSDAAAGIRSNGGDQQYFEHTRPELRMLVPGGARRVLDVGCGAGALGAALKGDRRQLEVVGLEGFPDAAERARERLDDALCVDLDSLAALPAEAGQFDAMVFGDVLEHLRDPERLLRALLPSLSRKGVLICSIPNVKHWSVLYPLIVHDRWTYDDAGLLDRTHIRFFTIQEFGELLARLGLEVVKLGFTDHVPLPDEMAPLVELAVEFGADRKEAAARLGAYQYLVVARRAKSPRRPEPPKALPSFAADPGELRRLVPSTARRVLDVSAEPDGPPAGAEPYDAMVFEGVLEQSRDPVALMRSLLPSLAPDGVVVCSVPNVRHWSVVHPLLAHDRWSGTEMRFYTLEELSEMVDELGLEGIQVVPNDRAPLPDELTALLDYAAAAGAEREETRLRMGAFEYFVVARRATQR